MAGGNPQIPQTNAPISDDKGIVGLVWRRFFELISTYVSTLTTAINAVPGVNYKTVAQLNALGLTASDAGYVAQVTDTIHLITWDGAAWGPLDGDESGRIEFYVSAPSSAGWALCDGSATTLLQFGATLTLAAFTTPNLAGTAAYLKSTAAYTGTLNPASGASTASAPVTDSQGAHTHGGATGSHTHTGTTNSAPLVTHINVTTGGVDNSVNAAHTHTFTSDGSTASISSDGSHTHTVNSHTHGLGTLDVPNLEMLAYVRR